VSPQLAVQDRVARLVGGPDRDHTIERDRGREPHDQRPIRPDASVRAKSFASSWRFVQLP